MLTPLQNKIFEIFKAVKKICEDNHLRYYAIGGTCLGAVRHEGFIPWDDDLDIAMPDRDFLKFMEIAPKELPENLSLIKIGELPNSVCFFAKVHDVNTTFLEKGELQRKDSYKGVFIDIMPFCGLPQGRLQKKFFLEYIRLLKRMNHKKRRPFCDARGIDGKLLWIVTRAISCFFSKDLFVKCWLNTAFRYPFDCARETTFLWSDNLKKRIMKQEWFGEGVELLFETTTIRCPKDWDSYLSKHFGDYMKLPPESQQVACHGGGIVDLERSYKYYQENGVDRI